MINARLSEINKNEVLIYLGYKGQEIPEEIEKKIDNAVSEVLNTANPRLIYRILKKDDCSFLKGNDVKVLLKLCSDVVLFAVTMGQDEEKKLLKKEVKDMTDALIYDACLSTAIENVCDNFEKDFEEETGLYLTSRFSPGYGDLDLSVQKAFLDTLDARKIGLTVTDTSILTPRKSVTAVSGISKEYMEKRKKTCEICSMFKSCTYRKEGKVCNE